MNSRIISFAIIGVTFALLSAGLVMSPPTTIIPDLEGKMEDYYNRYPQQKAYLHLDKEVYTAGEKLWYKAYLLDARTHLPDTISTNLIVEVINSYGQMSLIQLLKLERGFARGDFHLPDTLREGLYQVRAYTNWMRNFDPGFYFRKEINVYNPGNYMNLYREDKIQDKKHKRKSTRKAEKLDVQFFPEGGYLLDGVESVVGFKGINQLGLGVPVRGRIIDKKKNEVARFESSHLGMGSFTFTPQAGVKYSAEVEDESGKFIDFDFPEVQSNGYFMRLLSNDSGGIRLQAGSSFESPTILIACHMRGKLLFADEYRMGAGDLIIDIPSLGFPSGVVHITLFDSNREPRCERLAFVHSDDLLDISIRQDKSEYEKFEAVELTLTARYSSGRPVEGGHFSLSVADRDLENHAGDFQSNIVSNFLLSSDIAGRIEQPDYYFRNRDAGTRQALDILLLTQGWRRFEWNDIIYENAKKIIYPIQKGLLVRGKVTKELLDIPLKNLPVTLTVLSEFNDVYITRSDNKGEFEFELPDYEDTIQVEITARRLNGKKNLVIYLDENNLEEADEIYSTYTSEMIIRGTNTLRPLEEKEQDSMQVSTKGIYSRADNVLYVDDAMRAQGSVLEMIQGRIPGVVVSGNSVQIRGPSSFTQSTEPLYLIDNIPTDVGAVQALNPYDVERIEVLKGPSAAIYGVRGANGVIAIYTRRGTFMVKGKINFEMLGYHRPREFYSPKYGTDFDDLVIDERSSIFWDPDVLTDGTGTARIKFYNSDKTTDFFIVVEGVTPDGKIGHAERSYTVK